MATTPHLGLTLIDQSQAQKEVTANRAFKDIDAILNTGAIDRTLATPPASPAAGDVYIVAASPTGAWAGNSGKIAYFDTVWYFITPREGMTLWANAEDVLYSYTGSAWVAETDRARSYSKQQLFGLKTLTDAASIAWDLSANQVATVTLAGNRALANPSGGVAGATYLLIVKQDATGSRTLSYGSNFKFPSGTAPTLSTTANAIDVLSFVFDGTRMLGVIQKNFA